MTHDRLSSTLPSLPLLLWRTPPGLQLILKQEGIPHEIVRDLNARTLQAGRFIIHDGRGGSNKTLRGLLLPDHVPIDVDQFRRHEAVDPFKALIDNRGAAAIWDVEDNGLTERVARRPKAWVRRKLIDALREIVAEAGGTWMRLSPFPHPYRSAFNLRIDLDEPSPDDYRRFARARAPLADCCTHFVSTDAYGDRPSILADLRRLDTQSHGHFHFVYRNPALNRRNIFRADSILREAGIHPIGFAAPHGRWNVGLDDALEEAGYLYSSDFQIGYDDLPFFPWKGDRFSKVLQVPIHPVCEGLFLEAGIRDQETIAEYFQTVIEHKLNAREPALIYGHPERRLARMPRVLAHLARLIDGESLVWRTTLTDWAGWWCWRQDRRWMVVPKEDNRFEVQFDEWDPEYPLGLEIFRGRFHCAIPVTGPRMLLRLDDFAYERQVDPIDLPAPPRSDPRRPTLKDTIRKAIDWETVTPIEELAGSSLPDRLKLGLRWLKLQRSGMEL